MRARSPGRLRLVIATALPAVCFGLLGAGVSTGSASALGAGTPPLTGVYEPLSGSPIDPENTPTPTAKPSPTPTPKATATATPRPTATPESTATPVPTARPTPAPTQAPRPASTPGAAVAAQGGAPYGGGGAVTNAGSGSPGAPASVAAPPANASPTAAPPPAPVSTPPGEPVSVFGGLAVLPGALEALGKDPRTNQLNLDVIAAEALVAVSIGLCILLTELRRRHLV